MLIVDDGSPDGTGEIVDEIMASEPTGARAAHVHRKMGLGTAYIAGFRWALERDYEYVLEMDADFSHDPTHLPAVPPAPSRARTWCSARVTSRGG